MLAPSGFNFSNVDQWLLSYGTAARLLSACVLGGIVGLERESRHKASGLRTNMLMCLACAFFTLLSANLAGDANPDKGRVASNIVQGVGFLGAGLILHTKSRVLGLTSAATVFVEAALATAIVVAALRLVGYMEWKLPWKQFVLLYEVRGQNQQLLYGAILHTLDKAGIRMNVVEKDSFGTFERVTFAVIANKVKHDALLRELRASDKTDEVMAFPDTEQD